MRRRRYLTALILGAVFAAWFALLRPSSLGGQASYIMVAGESMEPTLHRGDLALVRKRSDYRVGDIVAYRGDVGRVIHRIVGGSPEAGFVLQGDNKDEPDPWRARPESMLGKMWFHIPGGGSFLAFLREPENVGILVGSLAGLTLFGGTTVQTVRRRRLRRGGGQEVSPRGTRAPKAGGHTDGPLPAPLWAMAVLAVITLLSLALVAAAVYSFREPSERSQFVERTRYEHTATFDYTVHAQPSTLYPTGVIGPVAPSQGGETPATASQPPPIYTRLARSLDLGIRYTLKSPLPQDVAGEISLRLDIKAGQEGWTKTEELLPPVAFAGPTTSARATVDLAQVLGIIETVEQEIGTSATSYDLSVVPTIRLNGRVGGESVNEVYAPVFTMKLDRTRILPDPELVRREVPAVGNTVSSEHRFSLFGLSIPVATARWLTVSAAAVSLALAGLLAAVVFLGLGRKEVPRIRARYGSMLISVTQADLEEETQRVQVASMRDLARLAQRDGQIIFHQALEGDSHLYFVPEGSLTYEYRVIEHAAQT